VVGGTHEGAGCSPRRYYFVYSLFTCRRIDLFSTQFISLRTQTSGTCLLDQLN
jgi:hypothetical protein